MELFNRVLSFYKIPSPTDKPETDKERFKRVRIISFLTATLGYGVYYVCRLSMNVIRKPMPQTNGRGRLPVRDTDRNYRFLPFLHLCDW